MGELGENLAGLDAARRSEALIGGQLLPQSELSFRSALAAYENGKVDFATLLDAQRQNMATDRDGAHVYLARNAWELGHTQREWPKIKLATTREQA